MGIYDGVLAGSNKRMAESLLQMEPKMRMAVLQVLKLERSVSASIRTQIYGALRFRADDSTRLQQ